MCGEIKLELTFQNNFLLQTHFVCICDNVIWRNNYFDIMSKKAWALLAEFLSW